jgi:hypothetical protein
MGELVAAACSLSFLGVAVKIMELVSRACPSGAGEVAARKLVLYHTARANFTVFHCSLDSTRK